MIKEEMTDDILQVQHLSLRREGRDILRHVNLTARTGELHALEALDGSGKTSRAYALMGATRHRARLTRTRPRSDQQVRRIIRNQGKGEKQMKIRAGWDD